MYIPIIILIILIVLYLHKQDQLRDEIGFLRSEIKSNNNFYHDYDDYGLENYDEKDYPKKEYDDEKSIVITCGSCGKQSRQNKNQGEITITCSGCSRVSKITT